MKAKKARYQKGSIKRVRRTYGYAWEVRFSDWKDGKRYQRTLTFDGAQFRTEKDVRKAIELNVSRINSRTVGAMADAKFNTITALYRTEHAPELQHSTWQVNEYLLTHYIDGGSAIRFAQVALAGGIGAKRDELLTRNVDYHLLVSDALERYGEDAQLGSGRLAVLIECGGSGYLKIGPAIEAMEAEAEGLGAAFYWTLTHALYKVMRLYNHDDAMMYEEQMREYAAQDDEENKGQYEFPEVEKALPECIRKTLKRDYHAGKAHDRRLLRLHRKGRFKD